jgi:hypothetical protein
MLFAVFFVERAAVREVGGDTCRTKRVAANFLGDPGRRGAPADHPPGIRLAHRLLGQLVAAVATAGTEQPAFAIFGEAGGIGED